MAAARTANATAKVASFTRKRPSRKPLPEHLPRERKVVPGPTACACCGGARLPRLGEDITETLEVIPKSWKVIQHVREKLTCRDCEKISQAPAPFHVIARGLAGPSLLAMVLFEKFGQHQPLNRQAERYAKKGVPISLSILADQVGGCTAALTPLFKRLEAYVLSAERLHGEDTRVPVLAKCKTDAGWIWVYVRDDKPFGGQAPPGQCSITRAIGPASIPRRIWPAIPASSRPMPTAAMASFTSPAARPARFWKRPCWVHARRPFFVMADLAEHARRKAQGKKPAVISPLALEAVRRNDALFDRASDQWPERRKAQGCPPGTQRAAGRRSGGLDASAARQALARQRRCQGHGLHAQALERVYALPRRRSHLPVEQRRRAWRARHRFGSQVMVVLRLGSRGRACRRHVQPDRHAKMNNIDPQAWLADVLARIAEHPVQKLDELLPWSWRKTNDLKRAAA
jgi:transposase